MTARWIHGDAEVQRHTESRLEGHPPVLGESARRRLLALSGPTGDPWVVKQFLRPRRRRLQRFVARQIAASPAQREWRALEALQRAKLLAPKPLGLARADGGEEWLVMRRLYGVPLAERLRDEKSRPALLGELGSAIAQLHAAGWVHGDLHIGNVLMTETGPALLDFQDAHSRSSERARVRDIASFDFSLMHFGIPAGQRAIVCAAAIGSDLADTEKRRALNEIARATRERARRYYRSRTRRCLKPGRLYARVAHTSQTGMRLANFPEASVFAALDAHRDAVARGGPAVLKCDHRGRASAVRVGEFDLVVKEVRKGGFARALADRFRGSPARRAWVAGHGLHARGIGVARPLAFVEQPSESGSSASWVVLEDLRPARPVGAFLSSGPGGDRDAAIAALCQLVIRLHESGVDHGDLQAHHVFLARGPEGLRTALIDLEGVRFPRQLRDSRRIRALAELNASLHDDLMSAAERRKAFRRYANALPFREGSERALASIVSESLARQHQWTGRDCGGRERLSSVEP